MILEMEQSGEYQIVTNVSLLANTDQALSEDDNMTSSFDLLHLHSLTEKERDTQKSEKNHEVFAYGEVRYKSSLNAYITNVHRVANCLGFYRGP
jgi:hypothetical protein